MSRRWTQDRLAAAAAGAIAAAVVVVGFTKGTWAVGGSDSSCYALMADAFAHADVQPTSAMATRAPWPDARRTVAPAGFIPSPVRGDAASPVCAPGFALLLTPLRWLFGVDGIFAATPLAGGLVVWLAFVIGRHLAGPSAGVAAALVVATMPVLLFQVVQPMNDVSGAALWLLVVAAALLPEPSRPWAMGGASGVAVLVRPNLAPLAVVVVAWLIVVLLARDGWSRAFRRSVLAIVVAAAPSAVLLACLNRALYGNPLQSGYGSPADLFSAAHIDANLMNYGAALWASERGFPLLGLLGVTFAPARRRGLAGLILAVAASTAAVYVLYRPFPEWWYLRFLLPALVPMSVLGCAVLTWTAERVSGGSRLMVPSVVTLLAAAGLAWFHLSTPAAQQAFDLARLERRFRTTGELVRDRFSDRAVFITVWQSGTMRYHAGREAVLWDALAPEGLEPAVQWLSSQGFEPYILTEEWEEPLFRQRFDGSAGLGALDWPPRFTIERQVRIYAPADRARYRAGEDIRTEFVQPR
jgi:hypothetical protein